MSQSKLLVYFMRRDLRVSDNPIFHHLSNVSDHGFTHLLPIYVLPANQIEISGFLEEGKTSPYEPAISKVGKFWRCGPHRAKFIAESLWDLKESLESFDSGLILRVGTHADVLKNLIEVLKEKNISVDAVWMTEEKSYEEVQEQNSVASMCKQHNTDFKLWADEKYFVDDRDTKLESPQDLPDVFTTYRKSQEPLRNRPRPSLPRPEAGTLPPLLDRSLIPPQCAPFLMPEDFEDVEERLLKPVRNILPHMGPFPPHAQSAHPFKGGESRALERIYDLIKTGDMTHYKKTRNGLVGAGFSTKLSGYLSLGSVTARQVHEEVLKFEDGKDPRFKSAEGYGKGENEGTRSLRFELLWRDYMRLCTVKYGKRLFYQGGFKSTSGEYHKEWKTGDKTPSSVNQRPSPPEVAAIIERFKVGTTGMGLIDASQRELFHTGYTSNRARQNMASFLTKHLQIDWRYGAEWYEMLLVDYDVSSNWANWQYIAGVGNDPRGEARIFNPVKQAYDYDTDGAYVRTWVAETQHLEKLDNVFQMWTTKQAELDRYGLTRNIMVTDPVMKIDFSIDRRVRPGRRRYKNGRGGSSGLRGGGANIHDDPANAEGSGSTAALGSSSTGTAEHMSDVESLADERDGDVVLDDYANAPEQRDDNQHDEQIQQTDEATELNEATGTGNGTGIGTGTGTDADTETGINTGTNIGTRGRGARRRYRSYRYQGGPSHRGRGRPPTLTPASAPASAPAPSTSSNTNTNINTSTTSYRGRGNGRRGASHRGGRGSTRGTSSHQTGPYHVTYAHHSSAPPPHTQPASQPAIQSYLPQTVPQFVPPQMPQSISHPYAGVSPQPMPLPHSVSAPVPPHQMFHPPMSMPQPIMQTMPPSMPQAMRAMQTSMSQPMQSMPPSMPQMMPSQMQTIPTTLPPIGQPLQPQPQPTMSNMATYPTMGFPPPLEQMNIMRQPQQFQPFQSLPPQYPMASSQRPM